MATRKGSPSLKVQHLSKAFGNVVAVDDVTFEIASPQMVGIIGRSGAGKSTLLRMLNRLTPATSGVVEIDGRDILQLRGGEMRRWQRDCAMIFQQFNLVPRLSVISNVILGRLNRMSSLRSLAGFFSESDIADGLAALDRLGIADKALQRAEELSGGQQQRVAIARALMQQPKMLLADEPIASLDPLSAETVMRALRQIHERDGLTVICNLHTLDTARTYCERVIGMQAGRIVFDGPSSDLSGDIVRQIYGAEAELDESITSTAMQAKPASPPVRSPAAATL